MPAAWAAAITSTVVCAPPWQDMRKMWSSALTSPTPGRARSLSGHPAGTAEKLTSRRFCPGTEAFSLRGESSATSLPWSTMATRSQSLSASSM
jgi:hypothetical protein